MLESIAAIATLLTAGVGIFYLIRRKNSQARIEKHARSEIELAAAVEAATTDEERKRLSEELAKIRSRH